MRPKCRPGFLGLLGSLGSGAQYSRTLRSLCSIRPVRAFRIQGERHAALLSDRTAVTTTSCCKTSYVDT